MIYGLVGYAGAGKTTIAREAIKRNDSVKILSLSQPITDMLIALGVPDKIVYDKARWNETLYGMGGKTCRYLAQTLGNEWGRKHVDNDLWINIGIQRCRNLITNSRTVTTVIIESVRFQNEFDEIMRNGGKLIAIHRPDLTPDTAHESEQYIDKLQQRCDYHIYNVDLPLAVARMKQIIKA